VSSDKAALDEMVKKSGKMVVPIFEIEGQITVGFVEAEIKQALGLKA
jgi:arsenate reductase-like glutaredoxin family protein